MRKAIIAVLSFHLPKTPRAVFSFLSPFGVCNGNAAIQNSTPPGFSSAVTASPSVPVSAGPPPGLPPLSNVKQVWIWFG